MWHISLHSLEIGAIIIKNKLFKIAVEIINYLGDISEDFVFKSQIYIYIFKTEISTSEMVLTLIKAMSINLIYFF